MGNDDSKSVDETTLWVVEVWQGDGEVKDVYQLVSLVLNRFCEIDEVLIHHKRLLSVSFAEAGETLEKLSDVLVVDAIDLHEILEQHEDDVGEKARLLAEVRVLEKIKDLGR